MSEWAAFGLIVLTALINGAVNWGVHKTQLNGLRKDVLKLQSNDFSALAEAVKELKKHEFIGRAEYEGRQKDMREYVVAMMRNG